MKDIYHQSLNINYMDAIDAAYDTMNPTEQRISDYIRAHGLACCSMSARDLAEACACSPASIVRYARLLNFEGLTDLKYHIRRSGYAVAKDDIMLSSSDALPSMKQKALQFSLLSLRNTVNGIDDFLLTAAAEAILKAEHVEFCAMGSAAGAALSACSQFLSFGISASFFQDQLLQLRSAASLRKGDVLIGINYHNAAANLVEAFSAARKRGVTTILITAIRSGILSEMADISFFTPVRKVENSLNISASGLCQSMVLQLLLLRIWQLAPERLNSESSRLQPLTETMLR